LTTLPSGLGTVDHEGRVRGISIMSCDARLVITLAGVILTSVA
jgi:hypothetical protein